MVIWNENELKSIKKTILQRANFKYDQNNDLVLLDSDPTSYYAQSNTVYSSYGEELKDLYYTQDRNKVLELLNKTSEITFDPNNKKHYGLIKNLSEICQNGQTEDASKIFIIFKDLIAFYQKTISDLAYKIAKKCNTSDEIKNKMLEIKNSETKTFEEQIIELEIGFVLEEIKDVLSHELLIPTLKKANSTIRIVLVEKLRLLYNQKYKEENWKTIKESKGVRSEFFKRYQRENMKTLKKTKGVIY